MFAGSNLPECKMKGHSVLSANLNIFHCSMLLFIGTDNIHHGGDCKC